MLRLRKCEKVWRLCVWESISEVEKEKEKVCPKLRLRKRKYEKVWESMSMSEVKVVKEKEKVWESMRKYEKVDCIVKTN